MKCSVNRIVLGAAFLLLPVISNAAGLMTSGPVDRVAAVQKRIDQWLDGYNHADVARMMDVFGSDFLLEQQNEPRVLDKAGITQSYTNLFAAYNAYMEGTTEEIRVAGDMAYDRGTYTFTLTPKTGGASISMTGRFLEVWKRENGHWNVQRLMNLNNALK